MASKYDFYWQNRLQEIAELLENAYKGKNNNVIDVSGIRSYGNRRSWYGVVDVYKDNIEKGEMAHAKSLGKVILRNDLLKNYGTCCFTLNITDDCKLSAYKNYRDRELQSRPRKPKAINKMAIKTFNADQRVKELVEILSEIPWESWVRIVEEEPEWHHMEPFLDKYGFGQFAVLMIVTGLNDFQLKGKAEVAYWIPIRRIFDNIPSLGSLDDIGIALEPFYQNERYDDLKTKRLWKFLKSSLARLIWTTNPEQAVKIFPYVWRELAKTMNQEPVAKTISFAMKCFGVALLIAGKSDFDFTHIPIPVDFRVERFTENAGISNSKDADHIRGVWQLILQGIQEQQEQVTMLHLDSLIWQIGVLDSEGMKMYFDKLGATDTGEKLNGYLKGDTNKNKAISSIYSKPSISDQIPNEKVVCFISCCKSKNATGNIVKPSKFLSRYDLPQTWEQLDSGRKEMHYCINHGSAKTSALMLYNGIFYRALSKNNLLNAILSDKLTLIIISAGYGIIDALEPINDYDARLAGKVATQWRVKGLSEIIAEYLFHQKPDKAYGFFAGKDSWSDNSSTYRYFFTEGVKKALMKGLKAETGCFYRKDGFGASSILTALGTVFDDFINLGFDQSYLEQLEREGIIVDNINVGFRKIE